MRRFVVDVEKTIAHSKRLVVDVPEEMSANEIDEILVGALDCEGRTEENMYLNIEASGLEIVKAMNDDGSDHPYVSYRLTCYNEIE